MILRVRKKVSRHVYKRAWRRFTGLVVGEWVVQVLYCCWQGRCDFCIQMLEIFSRSGVEFEIV